MAKTELKAAYRAQNGLTGCSGPLMCALDSVENPGFGLGQNGPFFGGPKKWDKWWNYGDVMDIYDIYIYK